MKSAGHAEVEEGPGAIVELKPQVLSPAVNPEDLLAEEGRLHGFGRPAFKHDLIGGAVD